MSQHLAFIYSQRLVCEIDCILRSTLDLDFIPGAYVKALRWDVPDIGNLHQGQPATLVVHVYSFQHSCG